MLRFFQRCFRRPALRFGLKRDARSRLRDPRFASFLADSNRKLLNTDFQDAVLQGRRIVRHVLIIGLVAFGAWVAMESARALSVFQG
ncbi:MAG: hypothetical protein ACREFX_01135 [Opitutaceae bacterium]